MPENEKVDKHSLLFMGLVTSFQQNALIAMGKMINPATGKSEQDMQNASAFIDMLDMLNTKTKGNISPEESGILEQILNHLKLNYVEELNKPKQASSTEHSETASSEATEEKKSTPSEETDESAS
jgi:hypothetical protein